MTPTRSSGAFSGSPAKKARVRAGQASGPAGPVMGHDDVVEAARLLRGVLDMVNTGELAADGEDAPAMRAHLEGALRALDLICGQSPI